MPLLSECSNSTCFEVDRVSGKDRETGDSLENLNLGPLGDQTAKQLNTGLTVKRLSVLQLRLIALEISRFENHHHAARRKATISEIPSG